MNSLFRNFIEKPIFILLTVNILVGLFVFRDYGLSWDEPLFYDYADALGYAYSPREWLSGHFDLENSYGISGDDHKTRGPAYLFLAREPVYLLEAFGLDSASAWRLVNFLFFQLGIYFLYRLSRCWMKPAAALAAAALFAWQPLLWGHAFINPKDPPFLVFFLASVCLGLELVDKLANNSMSNKQKYTSTILAAIILGITTSIRVLGPLAGFLIIAYAVSKFGRKFVSVIPHFALYGVIAIFAMLITWPFLWENPVARFLEVFRLMSDNPTNLSVLFGGEVYRAGELPRRYFPFMLAITLTEPVLILFVAGVIIGYWKLITDHSSLKVDKLSSLTLTLFWFIILAAYVLIRRPAMYDGLRHFLFILPPIFIFAGFAFEFLIDHFSSGRSSLVWLRAGVILFLLLPGLTGIVQLHPYEYTYYNAFIGGTGNAFRQYETDYWLTCYKEAVERLGKQLEKPANLFVHREAYIAGYYADAETNVHDLRGAVNQVSR